MQFGKFARLAWNFHYSTQILQLAAKSARRADESPFGGTLSGLTLTKMHSILRQPKANFATAKFGFNPNRVPFGKK
jgi:hypothetical protein